jgi:arylsulfate sulfotransferase
MTQPALINPQSAAIAPGQTISFTASVGGNSSGLTWFVNGVQGGNATVGSIDSNGNYAAPSTSTGAVVTISAQSGSSSVSASVAIVPSGQVATTNNPQVALYTISPPLSASVSVQFGTTTSYGLTTWKQMAAGNDAPLGIYVAGMQASTAYHMRATLTLSNGAQFTDADHAFTTGAINTAQLPQISVSTPSGLAPQPGIEMLNVTIPTATQAFATDITGNVIWTYTYVGSSSDFIQPIKLLSNGHMILSISPTSSLPLSGPPASGTITAIREVDLAGNTIRELSLDTLNSRLAANGFNLVADTMHHDVTPLPNGHLLILVNSTRQFTNLTGYPGTTTVLGDQVVDLDPNWNPVWVWNSFDNLDVNRHPMAFPDWTHTNAIIYSQDDGNIIISMRHQNWLLKINYDNGQGDGSVLWHLGEGGDFTLVGGTDPTDWFWAQHGPSFASTNTTGVFSLAVFDDGNDRELASGATCAPPIPSQIDCLSTCACYSTGEVFQLDENAKTATITFHDFPNLYSYYGGNAAVLANGNFAYDICTGLLTGGAVVLELPQQENPRQIAWQMNVSGDTVYRAYRLPSLYPGVQW